MEISALNHSAAKASTIPFDKLAKNPSVSQEDKVKEACKQFEAVLLRQIIGEARKNAMSSTGSGESSSAGIYNDMINNQMADDISRSGAFGLAKSLQTQLVHQVLPKANAAPTTAAHAPLNRWTKNTINS